jgi:transcriptional regulator with XRE-family HTH domain
VSTILNETGFGMSSRDRHAERKQLADKLRVLGKSLTVLREKAGLSKRGLAKKLDVSPNFVWRIEKGETKRWPSDDQLNQLADGLSEYADEFRQAAGIVPLESTALLSKSQGLASTLESIHERFVDMLKTKGLNDVQIDHVLKEATEQTILDVVNGKEELEIGYGRDVDSLINAHQMAGNQIMDLSVCEDSIETFGTKEPQSSASEYLSRNEETFLPDKLPRRRHMRRASVAVPETVDAGDAKIVLKRNISNEERVALNAIAKVIAELLAK